MDGFPYCNNNYFLNSRLGNNWILAGFHHLRARETTSIVQERRAGEKGRRKGQEKRAREKGKIKGQEKKAREKGKPVGSRSAGEAG